MITYWNRQRRAFVPLPEWQGVPVLAVDLPEGDEVHLVVLRVTGSSLFVEPQEPWLRAQGQASEGSGAHSVVRVLFRPAAAGRGRHESVLTIGSHSIPVYMRVGAVSAAPSRVGQPSWPQIGLLASAWAVCFGILAFNMPACPGHSPGQVAPPPPPPDGSVVGEIRLDLTGDGLEDVVRVVDLPSQVAFARRARVEVLRRDPERWTALPVPIDWGSGPDQPAAGLPGVGIERFSALDRQDLTADGRDEVLVTSTAGAHASYLHVLRGQGGGGVEAAGFMGGGGVRIAADGTVEATTGGHPSTTHRYRWNGSAFREM